jgi:hypothetical protein
MSLLKMKMSSPSHISVPTDQTGLTSTSPTLINPYQKLKNIVIRDSTNSVNYNSSYLSSLNHVATTTQKALPPLASLTWGDTMSPKTPTHTRLFFQNINGLSTKDYSKWLNSLDWMRQNEIDVAGLAEPCINVKDPRVLHSYTSKLDVYGKRSYIKFSDNSNPSESKYQPGGSAILCVQNWRSRIVQQHQDIRQWGRFVGFTFRLSHNRFLTVITAYRCVYRTNSSMGTRTSIKHQRDQIKELGLSSTARSLCLEDLTSLIAKTKLQFGDSCGIILMMDANESIEEPSSQLPEFLRTNDLIDSVAASQEFSTTIASHERSTTGRRIDFIFVSRSWISTIQRSGYLPFYGALDSDHRGIYVDIDLAFSTDKEYIQTVTRIIGSHETTTTILKYQEDVYNQFVYHRIFERSEILCSCECYNKNRLAKLLNRLDAQITEIVLSAERGCSPRRPSVRWNPKLANVSLLIRYFKVKSHIKDSSEKLPILQSILANMTDPYKSEILSTIDINLDSKTGLKKATKLKRSYIRSMASTREDHYHDIASRTQPKISRSALRSQLYLKQCHRNIKTTLGRTVTSALTTIDIPVFDEDHSIIKWKHVSDPVQIETALIQRNITHFGQAHQSPFASSPLASELGFEGTNDASMQLLNGTLPLSFSQCDPYTQLILEKFLQKPKITPIPCDLQFDDFVNGLKHWNEKTTTSPSGRHLGHYKVLLNNIMDDDEKHQFKLSDEPHLFRSKANTILRVYYNVMRAAINAGITLDRWSISHTSMIQKVKGNSRIDKLRVIHIYEADYNLFLKIYWGRRLVYNSEKCGLLNEGQYGSRPGKKCSDQVLKKIMVYEFSALSRTAFATMDNDAKSCFDRIICLFAMLISLFYGLSRTIVQVQAATLRTMKYITKTALGASSTCYSHSPDTPIHGTGQGSCASPALWLHSSSFLMDILDEHSYGFTATSPIDHSTVKVHNQGFVDDTSLMANGGSSPQDLIQRLQTDAQLWSNLLSSSGGILELTKCLYYIIDYEFDPTGNPKMMIPNHQPLQISTSPESTVQCIQMYEANAAHKTLGCYRALDGNETTQFNHLLDKSKDWARQLQSKYLSRQEAWMTYHIYFLPQVLYSLTTTNLTQQQCNIIQSPVVNAILPLLGFNRHTSRSIVFGPTRYGGIGLSDLYTEMYTRRIESVLTHTRDSNSAVGRLMKINLNLIQLLHGQSIPYLASNTEIKYIQPTWFSGLHQFIVQHHMTIKIQDLWLPSKARLHDKIIMDSIHDQPMDRIQVINNWRLFFQVVSLSDMSDPDGQYILPMYLTFPRQTTVPVNIHRTSTIIWPTQGRPSERSFCYWKAFICKMANSNLRGKLSKNLGAWLNTPALKLNQWNNYTNGESLYTTTDRSPPYRISSHESSSRNFSRFRITTQYTNTLPSDCFPVHAKQTGRDMLVSIAHGFQIPKTPRKFDDTFDSYINTLPEWEQRLLSSWWTVEAPLISKFLLHDQRLIAVSDGGCKSPKGGYGVVVGDIQKQQMATLGGYVKGSPISITPFRCESYGMLATFVFVKHLSIYFKIKGRQRTLEYYCDGQALLNRISTNRYRTLANKDYLKEDLDLEIQILAEIKQVEALGFQVSVNFVRGHQKLDDQSTTQQIFNHIADKIASDNLHMHNSCLPFDLLPTMSVIVEFNSLLLTGHLRERIEHMVLFPGLYQENRKQVPNAPRQIDNLWWSLQPKTLHRFSRNDRFRLIKFNYDLLRTRKKDHQYDPSCSPNCPNCKSDAEDSFHILQCPSNSAQRQTLLNQLQMTMQDSLKDHPLTICMYTAVGAVLNRQPVPDITTLSLDTSEYLVDAYRQQTEIGWDNFCKGRWTKLWEPLLNHELYLAKQKGFQKKTISAEKWASNVLFDIWNGVLECWEKRNSLVHGNIPYIKQVFIRTQLMKEVHAYIQMQLHDQSQITIQDFHHKPIPWIVQWLRHQRGKHMSPDQPYTHQVVDLT